MEILIPGLALVALMVWASTRIKRNAARAYEEEPFETDGAIITKPEGMICPVEMSEGVIFEAFSKDYGRDEAGEVPQLSAAIRRYEPARLEAVQEYFSSQFDITSNETGTIGERRMAEFEFLRYEKACEFREFVKLIESGDTVFELRIKAVTENLEANRSRVETLLGSFRIN